MEATLSGTFSRLAKLADDDLAFFFQCGRKVMFTKDQEIVREGERNASLFIVQEGILHVVHKVKGRQTSLGRIEEGGFFGEISLFDPGPTTATVRAATRGVLIEMRRDHLDHFIASRPAAGTNILLALLEDMARRFRNTDQRLIEVFEWSGLLK